MTNRYLSNYNFIKIEDIITALIKQDAYNAMQMIKNKNYTIEDVQNDFLSINNIADYIEFIMSNETNVTLADDVNLDTIRNMCADVINNFEDKFNYILK